MVRKNVMTPYPEEPGPIGRRDRQAPGCRQRGQGITQCARIWAQDGSRLEVVAYAGLDLEVRESGKWKGQTKLSKRGSGRLRRILYMATVRCIRLKDSAFGAYYHRLVARGMKKREAMMAVMRKMVMILAHDLGYE
jgi:transposase